MKINTHFLIAGLLATSLLASCSRPMATIQRSPREHFVATDQPIMPAETATVAEAQSLVPEQQTPQANPAVEQLEASIQKTNVLSSDTKIQQRLNRVRTMLAAASAKATPAVAGANTTRKPNLAERLVLKKINKKIGKQLSPQNPEKAMLSTGTLATGAVLVLIGLLLLLLTTGTAASVGLVVLIVGAVLLLVGLF